MRCGYAFFFVVFLVFLNARLEQCAHARLISINSSLSSNYVQMEGSQ